jgi:small-conductance mechanosensitive channel
LTLTIVFRQTKDIRVRYHTRKITTYVVVFLSFFIIGRLWFVGFSDIGTFVGLLSAGLAIALRDLIASIAGWAYILWRRLFEVGDRIQIGEHAGDVIDQRLFRFTLIEIGNWVASDQSTGRVLHIPNSRVLTEVIANYSRGFNYIWNEISVLVTFESNWEKAKKILQDIVDHHSSHLSESAIKSIREAARKTMIMYSTLTPKVWTKIDECGVLLTIRYLCEPRKRRISEEILWEDILHKINKSDDIDFGYPTVRRYINPEEGKPRTGGPTLSQKT